MYDYTKVDLHGAEKVAEITTNAVIDNGSELHKLLRQSNPSLFESHTFDSFDLTIDVETTDQARVVRAWQYIYKNGCVGKVSSF